MFSRFNFTQNPLPYLSDVSDNQCHNQKGINAVRYAECVSIIYLKVASCDYVNLKLSKKYNIEQILLIARNTLTVVKMPKIKNVLIFFKNYIFQNIVIITRSRFNDNILNVSQCMDFVTMFCRTIHTSQVLICCNKGYFICINLFNHSSKNYLMFCITCCKHLVVFQ